MVKISGHGPSQPSAFFIADAAYGEDLRTGYAITGYQEALMRQFCNSVSGLRYDTFYRTCLIKDEMPQSIGKYGFTKNNAKKAYSNELLEIAKQHLPILVEEINTLRPNLLIPLGELSFNLLTSLNNIRKFRGSVMMTEGLVGLEVPTKVLPILGQYPYLNKEYKLRFITKVDFQKIPKYIGTNEAPDKTTNVWVAKTFAAFKAFVERSYDESKILVFDIETFMGMPTCISFCFDGLESVCAPFTDNSIDISNRVLMLDLIDRLLRSPIRKVNQNIKYDWKIMERWGFRVANVVGDTMLAASTIYCEFPKNLGFLTSIYTDLPYFKDEGREFDPNKHKRDQFYLYNAKDSLATHQIITKQLDEIREQGVQYVYDKLVQLIPVYRRMEDRGIRIDTTVREELLVKYTNLYEIQVAKLRELTNLQYLNPLSSPQMNKLVFTELGFSIIRGVKGTDEESLELLMVFGEAKRSPQFGKMILQIILDCRKIHKVIEILELPLYPDGRFRCEYNLAGTETGRTSAGKTTDQIILIKDGKIKVKNLGHSLQTIGKHGFSIDGETYGRDLRRMFVPSFGFSFVECDLSQAEARVDAVLASNFDILKVFDGPIGIHRLTGSWIYNCNPEEIKKNILVNGVDRYYMAKTVRHAGERNMKAGRMVMMTQRSLNECQKILNTFHKYQPEIREVFHHEVEINIKTNHCLIAPNGRRRDFFDRIDNHSINEGISQLPQAIVSDQTKFSFIPTTAAAPWSYLLVEAHDGCLAEVPNGREREFIDIYKTNVETPIDFRPCSLSRDYMLTIPCEAAVGHSWYDMEEAN